MMTPKERVEMALPCTRVVLCQRRPGEHYPTCNAARRPAVEREIEEAVAEAEARGMNRGADLANEVSLCDRNGTVLAAAPMRLSIVKAIRAEAVRLKKEASGGD